MRLTDSFGNVADIGDAPGVELRPVAGRPNDVGASPRLDRGGDARLDVVGVDHLESELDAERLFAFEQDLRLEQLVGGRHKIGPAKIVDGAGLRKSGNSS